MRLSTSILPQVGLAVPSFLSYQQRNLKNTRTIVYVDSFHLSQMDYFTFAMKATGTEEKDWTVTKIPVDDAITQGKQAFENGGQRALLICFME